MGAALDDQAIDALVGAYAAVGATNRKQQRRKRCLAVLAIAAVAGMTGSALRMNLDFSFDRFEFGNDSALLAELRASVSAELARVSEERSALEAQRVRLEARYADLAEQLNLFELQSQTLDSQRVALERQSDELALAIEAAEQQRQLFSDAAHTRPPLEEELRTIAAERQELDRRWRTFVVEDNQLGNELDALKRQRQAIDSQRQELERQKAELEAVLMDAASETAAQPAAPTLPEDQLPAVAELMAPETLAFAAEMIEEQRLADMRAGIRLGDGMSISLGLTRSASINGEQQIQNSLQLGNLGAGFDLANLGRLGGFVLQNGAGNEISAQALESVSTGLGSVIQNSLDDQLIRTDTIYDVRIQDVSQAINGLAAGQAITESQSFQR